ncbi:universal stress protein [Siminovitchia terrae]|uniref:Universal stress protein n=1 Tax=Siminovitchia terrae TaxID=1914933 RepID=A0A429X348_SIMTE|nr:universal stress protein [Siminovitchia terrae]RST57798.1 universal stress protein [Siminovitchia terrae]GIN91140.1 universal stress protein [Siminovitchia terrae]GIN94949.1 universal stress protein [Siminovitchia terrae]
MDLSYHEIIVAIDGSKPSDWAFKKAIEVAKRNDATLNLVHVVDTSYYRGIEMYDMNFTKKALGQAQELLDRYAQQAKEQGLDKVETIVEEGSPKTVITKHAAKKVNADLIICGATGINAVERMFLGSVSEHITRHAKCDVLVVRTEKE